MEELWIIPPDDSHARGGEGGSLLCMRAAALWSLTILGLSCSLVSKAAAQPLQSTIPVSTVSLCSEDALLVTLERPEGWQPTAGDASLYAAAAFRATDSIVPWGGNPTCEDRGERFRALGIIDPWSESAGAGHC